MGVGDELSATATVKLPVPAVVGVPLMTPVAGSMDRPAGREPELMDHVSGGVPPEATTGRM
jgi:hypothetical protein